MSETCVERRTARTLLINSVGQVLLFKIPANIAIDPKNPVHKPYYWITPGGQIEHDESPLQTARRELYEETGVADAEFITHALWYVEKLLVLRGVPTLFKEHFFVAHVQDSTVSYEHVTGEERTFLATLGDQNLHTWWDVVALRTSTEIFYPSPLIDMLEQVLHGAIPAATIHIYL